MAPYVLVLDQGGHSSRALVFDTAGRVVAQTSVAVATSYLAADRVEQNPQDILQSLRDVLADIAAQLGEHCRDILAVALIVQRSSIVAIDEVSGEPLSPILSWQDTRHANWLAEQCQHQQSWLRPVTGLRANAHYGASKMRWLLDTVPAIKAAAEKNTLCITPLAGFLCRHLTGARKTVVDAVIASRTLLTELAALSWSPRLLEFFALPENILPDICASLADYGYIAVGDNRIPLQLVGGDQSFFILSHGNKFLVDTVFINAGTGAFVQQVMDAADVPPQLLSAPLTISCNQKDSVVVAEGTVNAAATALDWWWQQSGAVFSEANWREADIDSRSAVNAVPVFINRITATGSPDWLPAGESFFTKESSVSLKAIAVLEAVVFALQRNMDLLAAVKLCDGIVVSGGLSRVDIFCQRIADISGKNVWRSGDTEACARGAAAQLLPSVVGEQHYQTFVPAMCDGLHERYRQWTLLMNQLSASEG